MSELTFPKVMMVSDEPITKNNPGKQRVVWAYNPKFKYSFFTYHSDIQTLKDIENIPDRETKSGWEPGWNAGTAWKYAQEPQLSPDEKESITYSEEEVINLLEKAFEKTTAYSGFLAYYGVLPEEYAKEWFKQNKKK